jgi:hypothetical protein
MKELEETKKANYLVRLFKGDIPLIITFWVFGVLVGWVIIGALLSILEANYSSLAMKENGTLLIQSIYWLIILYSAFVLIAIWRSAGKYQGRSTWAIFARGIVIVSVILFAATFGIEKYTDYELNKEIRMKNESLPTMVDKETRLDIVTMKGGDMFYHYTLINRIADDYDIERLNNTMSPILKTNACETPEMKSLLEEGRTLLGVKKCHTYQ